jgi:diguanylate cyclase (GGDEF)-like protein
MLLAARALDDVRTGVAHASWLVSRYSAVALWETEEGGSLELSLREGRDIDPTALEVEALLVERAIKTGRTCSTIDRFVDLRDQALVDAYTGLGRLCLVRPLIAFGEVVGALSLHYDDRGALGEQEFDALRQLAPCAAASLSTARTRELLRRYAYADPLTGLANRRRFEEELRRLENTPLSILLIDFDGLKAVNDTLGYESGDRLITAVGVALDAAAAPGESVIRYGGDEFIVVIPGAGPVHAAARADELTGVLDRLDLPPDLARLFRGASVGWASAAAGEVAQDVLRRASSEMRQRKRRRNTDRGAPGPPDIGLYDVGDASA